ncbi:hypothetical protein EJ04DRAFT_520697 [Polyplosphaeria fusca]|uniref:Uncharacterized protein n=1 Tax=Polyplosphaeria fusca TaxID=682080 RepID=A0A9P4V5X7_9PLEO|nr:hypothetical protein EJ04DRAFT_520697 [Polyplosphaeria fusca]
MPSDGDCCANGQYCPSGYACSTSTGYLTCECVGSTCSQDNLDPSDNEAKSSSSINSEPSSTTSDYSYTPTSTVSGETTSTGSAVAEPVTTQEPEKKGLSQSDKIALGCGIGIGLPAALAAIVGCLIQMRG